MPLYKLSPINPCCITQTEVFEKKIKKKDYFIDHKVIFETGFITFELDSCDFSFIDLNNTNAICPFDHLDVIDSEYDHEHSDMWDFRDAFSDDERKEISNMMGWEMEENGWGSMGTETIFSGPLEITDENDEVIAKGS